MILTIAFCLALIIANAKFGDFIGMVYKSKCCHCLQVFSSNVLCLYYAVTQESIKEITSEIWESDTNRFDPNDLVINPEGERLVILL